MPLTNKRPVPPRVRIVVLGGGIAGMAAARRLDRELTRQPDVEVTLAQMSITETTSSRPSRHGSTGMS
jgi:NADH dehydrogenase FAD-containing subunit